MEPTHKDTKTPKSSSSSSSSPPWLDLPDPLTELILERLPLLYYLRFAAVCRKWRSIQKSHRLRYSPSPPPMAPSLPWLIGTDLLEGSAWVPNCYSPFDQTLHRLRLPFALPLHYFLASAHGWLLLLHQDTAPSAHITSSLLNPITGHHILLPPLDAAFDEYSFSGAISAPPSDPRCALLISIDGDVFLHRLLSDHNKWTRLYLPDSPIISIDNRVLHSSGKFYCVSEGFKLHVIDPFLPVPSLQLIEMDTSQFLPYVAISDFHFKELDGEILILVNAYNPDRDYSEFEGFHLFTADLSRNVWVGMEGIGDRALFVAERSLISSLSAHVGCNKNCIYFSPEFVCGIKGHRDEPWRMFEIFNLETNNIIYEHPVPESTTKQVLLQFGKYNKEWFMPSLDYVNSAEASSSGSKEQS